MSLYPYRCLSKHTHTHTLGPPLPQPPPQPLLPPQAVQSFGDAHKHTNAHAQQEGCWSGPPVPQCFGYQGVLAASPFISHPRSPLRLHVLLLSAGLEVEPKVKLASLKPTGQLVRLRRERQSLRLTFCCARRALSAHPHSTLAATADASGECTYASD